MFAPPSKIEFLFTPGCPSASPALRLLRQVLAEEECEARVFVRVITGREEAIGARFHGSPTIRIDGVDIEGPLVERDGYHLRCRTYHPHGSHLCLPHAETIRQVLDTHRGRPPRRLTRTGEGSTS